MHKQSSPETKWPPRDKGLMVWNTITTAVTSCDSYSEGQFSVQAPVVILGLCLDMFSIDYSTTGLVAAVIERVTEKVAPSAFCSCYVLSQAVL